MASRARSIGFRITNLLFAAGALGGLFGIGLVIGWTETDEGGIHRVHDIGFGVLYGVLLTVAFVAIAWKPQQLTAFFQVLVVALAALIGGLVSADASYLVLAVVVGVAAAIRIRAGLTQRELASVIGPGVDRATVARYELGTREPRGDLREAYAEVLSAIQGTR